MVKEKTGRKLQEGDRFRIDKKTGKRVYSVGSPMGVDSSDSFYSFLTYMDAYNVKLVEDDGDDTGTDVSLELQITDMAVVAPGS